MRFLIRILIALAAVLLVTEIIVNLDTIGHKITFMLIWYPPLDLHLPVWVALMAAFSVGFFVAVALEAVAWYEYTRTIRLQREQIRGLQDALKKKGVSGQ